MSQKAELNLKSALISTGLVQPVESSSKKGRLEVMCRQIAGQEKPWLDVVTQLLETAESTNLTFHICRRYVLKDGMLVFGWHIQIEATTKGMDAAVVVVAQILAKSRPTLGAPIQRPQAAATTKQPFRRPAAPGQHPVKLAAMRAPAGGSEIEDAPEGYEFKETVVVDRVDEDGTRHVETEVPLPHVYRDSNVPSKPIYNSNLGRFVGGGRGAKNSG